MQILILQTVGVRGNSQSNTTYSLKKGRISFPGIFQNFKVAFQRILIYHFRKKVYIISEINYLLTQEILHTETNRGKKAITVDGYVYRRMH